MQVRPTAEAEESTLFVASLSLSLSLSPPFFLWCFCRPPTHIDDILYGGENCMWLDLLHSLLSTAEYLGENGEYSWRAFNSTIRMTIFEALESIPKARDLYGKVLLRVICISCLFIG